jgi:hypothetical protein
MLEFFFINMTILMFWFISAIVKVRIVISSYFDEILIFSLPLNSIFELWHVQNSYSSTNTMLVHINFI